MIYGDSTWIKKKCLEYEIDKLLRTFEEESDHKIEDIILLRIRGDRRLESLIHVNKEDK